jgi:Methyltransferase domain
LPPGLLYFWRIMGRYVTEHPFPSEYFERIDESDDRLFYVEPRLVVHIDDEAIATVGRLFRDFIPPHSAVLDLMSSWRSHWPQGHPKERMVGLGLNAVEMADNPDLDEYVVHNINEDPLLPFEDEIFDATVITVSVQYLTRPVETFQQVNRILRPGGIFIVTFSNRLFPTKAVRIWRNTSDRSHLELVASYMDYAGKFEDIKGGLANPHQSPPGDPLFVVMGRKQAKPGQTVDG